MEFIAGIIFIVIIYSIYKWPEWTACNRKLPGNKTDWSAMNKDLLNGKSNRDIYKSINQGKYDIPNKK